jgi:hypothetical protein
LEARYRALLRVESGDRLIANNPTGCSFGQLTGPITCTRGLLVIDPFNPTPVLSAFDPGTNTGVVKLHECAPNGATVGPKDALLLGGTPQNRPNEPRRSRRSLLSPARGGSREPRGARNSWLNEILTLLPESSTMLFGSQSATERAPCQRH